jgi:hypothetical protein
MASGISIEATMSLDKSMKTESSMALKIQLTPPGYLGNPLLTTVTLVAQQQLSSKMERENSLESAQMATAWNTEMKMTHTTSTSTLLSVAGSAVGSSTT